MSYPFWFCGHMFFSIGLSYYFDINQYDIQTLSLPYSSLPSLISWLILDDKKKSNLVCIIVQRRGAKDLHIHLWWLERCTNLLCPICLAQCPFEIHILPRIGSIQLCKVVECGLFHVCNVSWGLLHFTMIHWYQIWIA